VTHLKDINRALRTVKARLAGLCNRSFSAHFLARLSMPWHKTNSEAELPIQSAAQRSTKIEIFWLMHVDWFLTCSKPPSAGVPFCIRYMLTHERMNEKKKKIQQHVKSNSITVCCQGPDRLRTLHRRFFFLPPQKHEYTAKSSGPNLSDIDEASRVVGMEEKKRF
jgi:hypothetical protein